jgi:hypothetical protein
MASMTKATVADRKASAAEVRAQADTLRQLAAEVGVTDVHLHANGTVFVHSEAPGYRQVIELSKRISSVVGCYVHIVTDDVPAAADAQPL